MSSVKKPTASKLLARARPDLPAELEARGWMMHAEPVMRMEVFESPVVNGRRAAMHLTTGAHEDWRNLRVTAGVLAEDGVVYAESSFDITLSHTTPDHVVLDILVACVRQPAG